MLCRLLAATRESDWGKSLTEHLSTFKMVYKQQKGAAGGPPGTAALSMANSEGRWGLRSQEHVKGFTVPGTAPTSPVL